MKGIYLIKNLVTNKVYIGRSKNLSKRKSEHFRTLNLNSHRNSHLQKSYNKYGKENFEFKIIEECSEDKLIEREDYWCKFYDSHNILKGYNIALTDETSQFYKHSEETKIKMSNSRKGISLSETTKQRISKSKIGRIASEESKEKLREWYRKNDHPMLKGHSEESKKKMSISKKGMTSQRRIKVKCENILTNKKFIFNSISEASEQLLVSTGAIHNNLKNKTTVVKKYLKFEYA